MDILFLAVNVIAVVVFSLVCGMNLASARYPQALIAGIVVALNFLCIIVN